MAKTSLFSWQGFEPCFPPFDRTDSIPNKLHEDSLNSGTNLSFPLPNVFAVNTSNRLYYYMGYSRNLGSYSHIRFFYYLPSPHRCGKFVLNSSHSWDNCKLHNRQIHWIYLAGLVGFEPTNVGVKVPKCYPLHHSPMCLYPNVSDGHLRHRSRDDRK